MSHPTPNSILRLYSSMLRTSRSFSSYNFREYFVRRTKSTFREIQAEKDPLRAASLFRKAAEEHTVLKRSALVNQLYGGWRLVVEKQKPVRQRSDS
ncbi:hypothetical protein BD410DRAFT_792048 [Rickenella mellea]|uniref:Complex 1 LYR protein domain-containing protein n=1 Tax=Rickenella mellea TaxID=50990 RepID=A0A4Y7PX22_9AGAM|nr:hypothetical protein BD410DRAFT_792048 [Rickenella mellea]